MHRPRNASSELLFVRLINVILGVFAESPIRAPLLTMFASHTHAGVCDDSDGGVSHGITAAENASCLTDTAPPTHTLGRSPQNRIYLAKTKGIRFVDEVFCKHFSVVTRGKLRLNRSIS